MRTNAPSSLDTSLRLYCRRRDKWSLRRVRRDPGLLQTRHIFTSAGEYEAGLIFKKQGSSEVHTIAFAFRIRDRRDIEIT